MSLEITGVAALEILDSDIEWASGLERPIGSPIRWVVR